MFPIERREFVALLGGAAAWTIRAETQQPLPRRVGVLLVGLSPESKEAKQFRLGLRDAGYFEGRDVVIEWRFAKGDYDRVPEMVADLVKSKVDVIVEDSTVGTEETRRATPRSCPGFHGTAAFGLCQHARAGCQFLRELPETLIDDLATKCGRPAHDHWTISASSGQHTSDY
jgi:hypothetical protein